MNFGDFLVIPFKFFLHSGFSESLDTRAVVQNSMPINDACPDFCSSVYFLFFKEGSAVT